MKDKKNVWALTSCLLILIVLLGHSYLDTIRRIESQVSEIVEGIDRASWSMPVSFIS